MAVSDWSLDASENGNHAGIPMYEGMAPAQVNDAVRKIMADVRQEHDDRVDAEEAIDTRVDDVEAALASQTGVFSTGDLKPSMALAPQTGWLLLNGATISNAAGGGTARANADTEALFTLLWNGYSNALLPIQDSAGVADVRGANAAADYAANKRMPLFDGQDEFFRMASGTFVIGTKYPDTVKDHTHSLSNVRTDGNDWDHGSAGSYFDDTLASATGGVAAPNNGGTETRPRFLAINVFIKL